jgi:hypothetical protein
MYFLVRLAFRGAGFPSAPPQRLMTQGGADEARGMALEDPPPLGPSAGRWSAGVLANERGRRPFSQNENPIPNWPLCAR